VPWGVHMSHLDRRTFLGVSLGAISLLPNSPAAFAQTTCVSGWFPAFLPSRLTVDCASRRNFQLFRQNSTYLGLAGVVSMTFVQGKAGSYQAGNLFLFPWLKPKGVALGATKVWNASVPLDGNASKPASPIPNATLPVDDYFCHHVLQAPQPMFIGFAADVPYSQLEARLGLYSNIEKLADGKPLGIDWASSNLNHAWFGGSRAIPADDACNGRAWRALIVEGLNQASSSAC
jgi:hypothetical protein